MAQQQQQDPAVHADVLCGAATAAAPWRLFTNCQLFTGEQYYERGALLVNADGVVEALNPGVCAVDGDEGSGSGAAAAVDDVCAALRAKEDAGALVVHDMLGRLVMPGFINAHCHFYGFFARGLSPLGDPPSNFGEMLTRLWWPLDRALTLRDVAASAAQCINAGLRRGCTTYIDHHSSPSCSQDKVLVRLKEEAVQAGVRVCVCLETSDRNGPDVAVSTLDGNVADVRAFNDATADPRVRATLGLHAAFTCLPGTLDRTRDEMLKLRAAGVRCGVHVHCAEGSLDNSVCRSKYGMSALQRLDAHGLLDEDTLLAHLTDVSEAELELIARRKCMVTTQPSSNMNNGVGAAEWLDNVKQDSDSDSAAPPIVVGLGTDGMTFDMLRECKQLYLVHKHARRDPRVMGADTLTLLFANNAAIATRMLGYLVGLLKRGYVADMAVLDYVPPTPVSTGNFAWHVQFGLDARCVRQCYVAGELVMDNDTVLYGDGRRNFPHERDGSHALAQDTVWERFRAMEERPSDTLWTTP